VNGLELQDFIDRYNEAWGDHDVDAIVDRHTEDSVFENHVTGDRNVGKDAIRTAISGIFTVFPDLSFETRRQYIRDDLVVQEWTATATHTSELRRGDLVSPASGRTVQWRGMDVIPYERGLVKRKDVYSDSMSILRQVGLL
jgi:steroid delta-isomerase-like uncharacterized protein